MLGSLEGKVALVIGAGSVGPGWGIGKATSILMARKGAKVVCLDINPTAAKETRNLIRKEGGEAIDIGCDVSNGDEVKSAIKVVLAEYGGLNILHHNVGINIIGGPVELKEDEWDRVIQTNLKSAYLVSRVALPELEKSKCGAIVFTSSIAGIRNVGIDYVSYTATKGALIPFSRAIAIEYARRNVRSNCVIPGLIDTPRIYAGLHKAYPDGDKQEMARIRAEQCPMGFMGNAWDIAKAVIFLASDDARYITATELIVDGGISSKV